MRNKHPPGSGNYISPPTRSKPYYHVGYPPCNNSRYGSLINPTLAERIAYDDLTAGIQNLKMGCAALDEEERALEEEIRDLRAQLSAQRRHSHGSQPKSNRGHDSLPGGWDENFDRPCGSHGRNKIPASSHRSSNHKNTAFDHSNSSSSSHRNAGRERSHTRAINLPSNVSLSAGRRRVDVRYSGNGDGGRSGDERRRSSSVDSDDSVDTLTRRQQTFERRYGKGYQVEAEKRKSGTRRSGRSGGQGRGHYL